MTKSIIELNKDLEEKNYFKIESAFGVETIRKGIQFIDKSHCVYLAGSNFVILDIDESKISQTIPIKTNGDIKNFIYSKSKGLFICHEELKNHENILFILYKDESKQRANQYSIENTKIISIAMSNNSEYLICQTGLPNWNLILFSCNNLKYLTEMKVISSDLKHAQTISEISFFPNDEKRILLVGNKFIKTYCISKNSFKILNYIPCDYDIEIHSWVNKNEILVFDKIGVGFSILLSGGKIKKLILKNELIGNILNSNNNNNNKIKMHMSNTLVSGIQTENDATGDFQSRVEVDNVDQASRPILTATQYDKYNKGKNDLKHNSIICTAKGFILGNLSNELFYYENEHDNEYAMLNKIIVPNDLQVSQSSQINENNIICEISYLNVSNEEYLICFTNKKKIYFFDFQNKTPELKLIFENFHYTWVTGIGMCSKKSFFVTCSLDRWLKVFNYETNQIEIQKRFNEDLLCVSIHPSGLFIALGNSLVAP